MIRLALWEGSGEGPPGLSTERESRLRCLQGRYSSLSSFLGSAKGVSYFSALTKVAPGAYKILLRRTRLQGTFFM